MRITTGVLALALLGGGGLYWWTLPAPLPASAVAGLTGDPVAGEKVFIATGCASCHMAEGATGDDQLVLAGGQKFPSDFGTFLAPNISQDPEHGIGDWSILDLANALKRGVSPEGEHLYPALPYASYAKLALQDIADLHAYMQGLPADPTPSQPHQIDFPYNMRMALGGWKLLYLNENWAVSDNLTPTEDRGRYLVEAMAHCAECHTPRTALGGLDTSRWLAGVAGPNGAPNITPAALDWSEDDIATYLTTGFTPDYDMVGGHMAHVVENFGQLPAEDAAAVAAYLKRVPASE